MTCWPNNPKLRSSMSSSSSLPCTSLMRASSKADGFFRCPRGKPALQGGSSEIICISLAPHCSSFSMVFVSLVLAGIHPIDYVIENYYTKQGSTSNSCSHSNRFQLATRSQQWNQKHSSFSVALLPDVEEVREREADPPLARLLCHHAWLSIDRLRSRRAVAAGVERQARSEEMWLPRRHTPHNAMTDIQNASP